MRFVEFRPSAGATYIPKSKPKKVKKVDTPTPFEKNVRKKKARKGDLKAQKPVEPIKTHKL